MWSGWEPELSEVSATGRLGIRVPVATEAGKPIVRRIREEFAFDPGGGTRESGLARLSYPAAVPDKAQARLTVRTRLLAS